jgi:hypothetical protein
MFQMCAASGCGRPPASKFSNYCAAHKSALRRHGHPDQKGVTKAELKPFREVVLEWIARNASNPAWGKLEARWRAVQTHAAGVVAAYEHGRASIAWDVLAAQEALRLAALVEPREVLVTVAAMVVMQDTHPRRFRSDEAFRAQVVRRVRGLTDASATAYTDAATGKTRTTYSDMTPRATAVLGAWLIEAMGIAGAQIARKEREAREENASAVQELHADLDELA